MKVAKVAELFCRFLATLDDVKKYVELIQKIPEAKPMMQLCSSDNGVRVYNIKISNLFYPELQLINTKLEIENKLKELLSELKKFRQIYSKQIKI